MQPAPADLAFGTQPFVILLGDVTGGFKRVGNLALAGLGIFEPVLGRHRRIDPNATIRSDADLAQFLTNLTTFAHLGEEPFDLLGRSAR